MSTPCIDRRSFLKGSAAVAGTAAAAAAANAIPAGLGIPAARALADTVPPEGAWVRTTCSPNCTGACGMKGFVQDGQIKYISQAADYPYDQYNPRGCLKGLSINTMLYGPNRLTKPLVRNAKGQMEETDWDTALNTAAEKLKAVMDKYGPDSVGVIWQVQGTGHIQKGSLIRLSSMMGWSGIGGYELNGDLPMFWPETFGCQSEELESYCWEDSRYTMIFGSNVMVTRLPDSQFLNRSREAGGKVIIFDPNYSATAEKSDEWIQLRPDSDAAFALAAARIIIDEKRYDEHFVKNFTDLPLLVNALTGKRIEAASVRGLTPVACPDYRTSYVAFDGAAGQLVATDPEHLGNTDAYSLEYNDMVTLSDGTQVPAKSGWTLLRERLEEYTVEHASEVTAIPADTITRIARECSDTKPMHIIFGGSGTQWYHGDLKGRSLALLAVLTGNIGQLGGGISTYVGQYKTRFNTGSWFVPPRPNKHSAAFQYAVTGRTPDMTAEFPKAGFKAFVIGWCNPFDQHNVDNYFRRARESGEVECIVTFEFQRTSTAEASDVVLASPSWYEKLELTTTPVTPWVQLQQQMVDPMGISQPEIWTCKELACRIDPANKDQWPEFTQEEAPQVAEDVLKLLLENGGPHIDQITSKELHEGPGKLAHDNPGPKRIPFWQQVHEGKPFPCESLPYKYEQSARFVRTGRIQFYRDEDIFLRLGEQLPCYKPPFVDTEYAVDPSAREKYPLAYLTRNSVFRVHSTYTNNPFLLELQNHTPKVFVAPKDAKDRNLEDGDVVEVYNSRGQVRCALVTDPGMFEGQAIFEEGWWAKYTDNQSYNSLVYPWINPTNEAYYLTSVWAPNMAWNECCCNIRLVEKGGAAKEVLK